MTETDATNQDGGALPAATNETQTPPAAPQPKRGPVFTEMPEIEYGIEIPEPPKRGPVIQGVSFTNVLETVKPGGSFVWPGHYASAALAAKKKKIKVIIREIGKSEITGKPIYRVWRIE